MLIGDAGTGKSLTARNACGPNIYVKPPGQWWDGYDGCADVVLNEIDMQRMGLAEILFMADSGPHMVPVKGGHVNFAARAIYATSTKDVHEWYPDASVQDRQALMRRIDSKTTFRWVEEGDVRTVKTTRQLYQVIPGTESPVPAPLIVEVPDRPLLALADSVDTSTPPMTP